jgi:hypothetical protein
MVIRLHGQKWEKRQPVTVELSSCAVRLRYEPTVRGVLVQGEQPQPKVEKQLWLVRVEVVDSYMQCWYLLTDWPINTPAQAARIFRMYRQRWAVEEAFQFLKMCIGWEEVQVLDLEAVGGTHVGGIGLGSSRLFV